MGGFLLLALEKGSAMLAIFMLNLELFTWKLERATHSTNRGKTVLLTQRLKEPILFGWRSMMFRLGLQVRHKNSIPEILLPTTRARTKIT
jgi:hypothetical protein